MRLGRKRFLRSCGAAALALLARPRAFAYPRGSKPELPDWRDETSESFWAAVRAGYTIDSDIGYLNTGGLGPAARFVQETVEEATRALQARVETGHSHFDRTRPRLAQFLGAADDEIAFVRNATEANGIIATGLELRPGDEVLIDSHAHPGGAFPWIHRQRQRGLVLKQFDPDAKGSAGTLARIEALMTARTKVLQVSHVTAPTGIVLPVQSIAQVCRARGIWLHVDGAQSLGMFPFALHSLDCDSYAGSGHKWLGAPHETGVLFVRRERLDEVSPATVGAHSATMDATARELTLMPSARRFEYGTRNAALALGWMAAIEWQEAVGRERITARGRALARRLREGLSALKEVEILTPADSHLSGSILTFRSARMTGDALFRALWDRYRLRCRPVTEQALEAVRVSCHCFNTPSEIDKLIGAVEETLRAA
jgi:selenocysteine lyase/cysteine desulfurase